MTPGIDLALSPAQPAPLWQLVVGGNSLFGILTSSTGHCFPQRAQLQLPIPINPSHFRFCLQTQSGSNYLNLKSQSFMKRSCEGFAILVHDGHERRRRD